MINGGWVKAHPPLAFVLRLFRPIGLQPVIEFAQGYRLLQTGITFGEPVALVLLRTVMPGTSWTIRISRPRCCSRSPICSIYHIGTIFRDNAPPKPDPGTTLVDRKLRRKVQEKKIAMGHKPDDHREYPDFCLTTSIDEAEKAEILKVYEDPRIHNIMIQAANVEYEGYCRLTRVEETIEFARKMGFHKIGIASCVGLLPESNILARVLRTHGFDVYGVACKAGAIDKTEVGIDPVCSQYVQPRTSSPGTGQGRYRAEYRSRSVCRAWETIEIDDMLYTKSWGPYANYADFDVLIRSVFTEQFWAERNEWAGDTKMYIDMDGNLYYISAAIGGDDDYNWDVPDTCRLVERTDDALSFTLIGHYSRLYPREDGTYGHTLEFPARMVRTADGWRVDQLYLPHRDRERLYGWEIQPWTGNE